MNFVYPYGMRIRFFLFFSLAVFLECFAQPSGVLTHFSHDVKLSQSRILDIQQDEKGFIWLATFSGLIRYDGTDFRNFKVNQSDSLNLVSNRVFKFQFDDDERIWIQSEKNEIYYFDTQALKFGCPLKDQANHLLDIKFKGFEVMPSGKVWLFPEENNSLVLFERNEQIQQVTFNKETEIGVQQIFEDDFGHTWVLTNAGIYQFNENRESGYSFVEMTGFLGKPNSFNCVLEAGNELWFGGNNGQLIRYSKSSRVFFNVSLNVKGEVIRLEHLENGNILIATRNQGFYVFDVEKDAVKAFNKTTINGFPEEDIIFTGITHSRQVWFGASAFGIYKLDLVTGKLKHLQSHSKDSVSTNIDRKTLLFTDQEGTVWVQPNGGAFSYWDEKLDQLNSISRCFKDPQQEVSDVMHIAMFDKLGNLWFCSFKQGLDLLVFNRNRFFSLDLSSHQNSTKRNVRSLMEDKQGNLWVATRTEKVTLLNSKKEFIGLLGIGGTLDKDEKGWGADIYNMLQDHQGRIWLGTRGNGLFCLEPKNESFHYKVTHYRYNNKDKYSLSSDNIYKIFQSSTGNIYVATWGGGVNLIQPTENGIRFINYHNEWKNYPFNSAERVRSIVEGPSHNMFFISPYDLFSFSDKNSLNANLAFTEYPQVSGNDFLDLIATSNNQIALATNGNGVLIGDIEKEGLLNLRTAWNEDVGFPIKGVVAMQEDEFGHIWIVGDKQIARFNTDENSAEIFPDVRRLIGSEIFSEATKCKLSNGEIMAGHSNGVVYFNPKSVSPFGFKPYLAITGFNVYNKELYQVNPDAPTNPDMLEDVVLKHNQNFFRVRVSALDYIKNENIVYRYKLEGVDEQWNYFKGDQSINYTNLGKGEYTLLISSTNSHNLWVDNQRKINIKILPSIWRTNMAYVIYMLLAIGLFWIIQRAVLTIMKLRNDVKLEHELSELKLKFFTDVSHEIRTPLTMITAPVEKMLADTKTPEPIKKQLEVIERNSNRLLGLVNQILDLRKIQNRKLEVVEINLETFISKICGNFKEVSLYRKIKLVQKPIGSNMVLWADKDSLYKMLSNLLANAFKYCHEGDIIEVSVEEQNNEVVLKVQDNGPGIPQDLQNRLFLRFSNYNQDPSNPSTGIGLSLVKDLADKHGASVLVESQEGKGSCFKICFKKGYQHFGPDVDVQHNQVMDVSNESSDLLKQEEEKLANKSEAKSKLVGLIVEDDPELRGMVTSILNDEYTIHEAENGIEGHLKATKLSPDFIISDIMMPQMDGIEMLKLIRNNLATSHIPIVLLSAKTSIESRLEGMEYGADEYLTKPFNISYLKARVKNILEQRKRLQLLYSSGDVAEIPLEEPLQISNQDHKFMLKVIELVKDNLAKSDFSVEELGKLMHMSRASFFNKLKGVSGVSPVKFIRDMRLSKAAEMIKTEDLLIKEICFEVGFNDLKYFGKCFKEKYKYTPAEYRNLYR